MAKKIILVHGLGGKKEETWGKFPELLRQDLELDCEVIPCGYESPALWKVFSRAPNILNIANGVLTDIRARCDIEKDEIIIAGHSLGGIIVKKILLILSNKNVSHRITKVCFFDVPHDGSGYANVGKYIALRNRHLKSLTRNSSDLDDINDQWMHSGLSSTLNILSIISANDDIVSSSSAKSIFRDHEVETINFVDHRTIVKPDNADSTVYVVFRNFILKKNSVARYRNTASRNLEDWKSVERNHGYQFAIDDKRRLDLASLRDALGTDTSVTVRLTGASGLGKTRLLLESIDTSTAIDESCILIFNAPDYEKEVKESVRKLVDDDVCALVVVENCKADLHDHLSKEVKKTNCQLKLVTLGYSHDNVEDSIHIKLAPLSDAAVKKLLIPILVGLNEHDVERVARFAQGYPLMATLIADQYQREGKLLGSIDSNAVVRRLIDGDGGVTNSEKEVLIACSLFDVFGTSEGKAAEEAKFIAVDIAHANLNVFDRVISKFTRRQIINRAGRYARLVPKPLALNLASEWWEEASYERQKQLIETLPDSLVQSFCIQASYLDSLPSVQRFSDKLFGESSPFTQAEALLTERGSRLFRAFVEVNPESTSNALYSILSEYSHDELKAIGGNTRRNLVWALEMLCFHADIFEKSAWCMLLLASAENEKWSNNATGMFAQLFRVNLSGTQAEPRIRFDLLRRAVNLNESNIDMIVLEALRQAIATYGSSRTVGAEYQGTKAPLEEWRPKRLQDVFDFWKSALDLLLALLEREGAQREKVLSIIGYSIRSFVARDQIQMLDFAIKKVISLNGRYWPEALNSIKDIFKYDSAKMDEETKAVVNGWLELLDPKKSDLSEKLKILITNPPWEHRKGDDGHYIDVASENAKALATELANNVENLKPHLKLLLIGEQKQSYAFGHQLSCDLPDIQPLIELSLEFLKDIEKPDIRLILGFFQGLFEKSPERWQKNIDRLLVDDQLVHYYQHFIRTGNIEPDHLNTLIELIKLGKLPPSSANTLSYGSVTDSVEPEVIADFCINLSDLGSQASWTALNVIYMYCFSNEDKISAINAQIKNLVTKVPLNKDQEGSMKDAHHWRDLADKLLNERDPAFAINLVNQLVSASKHGLDHGDIWSYIKPLMINLMRDYGEVLWPILGDSIIQAKGIELYWLQELLDRETGLADKMPSPLSVLPIEDVIAWCRRNPDIGPIFVARCLNIFDIVEEKQTPSDLFIALLEHFGNNQDVSNELSANSSTRGWTGSLVPYLEADKEALTPLLNHINPNVRRWVKEHINYIDRQIVHESKRDEERNFGFY